MIQYILRNQALTWIRLAHHQWKENFINDTTYIFSYPDIYRSIENSGSQLIKLARDRWNENVIDRFYLTFKLYYLKYIKSLKSKRKFELSISKEMWQHVFRSVFGSYIFLFLGYVPGLYFFLLVCGKYPLTSKMGRCSNLLSIDSWLNRIEPSTNIFLPNPGRGYRTKLEIVLEEVFPNSIE